MTGVYRLYRLFIYARLYNIQDSWTVERRVIAKVEHLRGGENPRFIVTNLPQDYAAPQALYEDMYCARGEMENRIKEQQLDLFGDCTSSHAMRANQLRLWFSALAYALVSAIRRVALKGTRMPQATFGTIRLKLFKVAARIRVSVRRFMIHLASAFSYQDVFTQAYKTFKPILCPYSCWQRFLHEQRALKTVRLAR